MANLSEENGKQTLRMQLSHLDVTFPHSLYFVSTHTRLIICTDSLIYHSYRVKILQPHTAADVPPALLREGGAAFQNIALICSEGK